MRHNPTDPRRRNRRASRDRLSFTMFAHVPPIASIFANLGFQLRSLLRRH